MSDDNVKSECSKHYCKFCGAEYIKSPPLPGNPTVCCFDCLKKEIDKKRNKIYQENLKILENINKENLNEH